MCGINGIIGENRIIVDAMNRATAHRGPDQTGSAVLSGATIGNNRLAIIDLSEAGRQPITTADGRYTIVFNGEVYNYKELRRELEATGVQFRGGSDTEVLVYAYAHWGAECVTRLRGMWGFAIHDKDEKTLFLSRDPFGIKPLYLYNDNKTIAFSSEIRGLLAHPDINRSIDQISAEQLITLGYILAPRTILKHARGLMPGESVTINLANRKITRTRHEIKAERRDAPSDRELEDVLVDSIHHHLIADVPVGLFFSGGIDSSVLAVLLKRENIPLTAFHISVPGRKDSDYARAIAKLCNLTFIEEELTPSKIDSLLFEVFDRMDQPLADSSLVPTLAVASLAQGNATVVLSGEGGDELFAGYPRAKRLGGFSADLANARFTFDFGRIFEMYFSALPSALSYVPKARSILRRAHALLGDPSATYLAETALLSGAMSEKNLAQSMRERLSGYTTPDQNLALDRLIYLPDNLLLKGDTATMARSLEGRVPFLDRRVFETVAGAPLSWKRTSTVGKAPLRRLLERHLPQNLIDRPKSGFGAPVAGYLLERGTDRLAHALTWYLESFPASAPALHSASLHALKRNDFTELIRIMGYSAWAVVALHAFSTKHNLDIS